VIHPQFVEQIPEVPLTHSFKKPAEGRWAHRCRPRHIFQSDGLVEV
jgi:hypothetical protein